MSRLVILWWGCLGGLVWEEELSVVVSLAWPPCLY